jgi:hypothetical protein
MTQKEAIDAAAAEIVKEIAEILKPWTEFYGHEELIAGIIERHLSSVSRPDRKASAL